MGLFNAIGKQLQHPKGVLGKALFGWMSTKTIAHAGWTAAVTFPVREKFMRFKPTKTEGFYFHHLADLEAAFRDAGFIETRTEHDDAVRFGAQCMLGRKAPST